ncbi:hypothetical protein H0H81_011027 [Sphagnurus paluster]|uniref:Uncharacterized protein n=1 Tax=Sphagnurus paluster TaxID=117069 RepID=A0A9P7GLN3_9AGAR|nr:hypothetical protein H0H81_011027 [Sphagnurus paluster]
MTRPSGTHWHLFLRDTPAGRKAAQLSALRDVTDKMDDVCPPTGNSLSTKSLALLKDLLASTIICESDPERKRTAASFSPVWDKMKADKDKDTQLQPLAVTDVMGTENRTRNNNTMNTAHDWANGPFRNENLDMKSQWWWGKMIDRAEPRVTRS